MWMILGIVLGVLLVLLAVGAFAACYLASAVDEACQEFHRDWL